MKTTALLLLCVATSLYAAAQKTPADLLITNATIYTVNDQFATATGMAIKNGRILETGDWQHLSAKYKPVNIIDAKGKFIYPGFIDAHSHFYGYALGLQNVNLMNTKSWAEVVQKVIDFRKQKNIPSGKWILGRGWDQNDWTVKQFPNKEALDKAFPDNPVILTRIDGHAAIVNQKALDVAGIKAGDKISGGEIEVKGQLTGILVDNAVGLVSSKKPSLSSEETRNALVDAQHNCFAVGLTTVEDCGINYETALFVDNLQKANILKMRIYAMLSDSKTNYEFAWRNGKIKTDRLNVRSFKVYADGALGSRGAALLEPYSDRHDWYGFLLSSQQHFDSVANIITEHGWQMCTHAIGDSGNRTMLKIYAKYLKDKNDLRWRIEHAQVINTNDFTYFGKFSIIPSVQPTHATSDMYWAGERLGSNRMKGAYAYKQLLLENGWLPLGTDFPVEDISPLKTFHSAVFRTDAKEFPKQGFQIENALTRQQAIRGMTIWAAKSNFEEKEKGSLERGKFADFIILDRDLMKIPAREVLRTNVLATFVNGEKVFEKSSSAIAEKNVKEVD
ncbi:MAG: amidohydrolase [Candidatus Dadabacteria bacterium]